MSENDTDGFVIAIAFDATCGKAVAQTVKFQFGNVQVFHHFFVITPISSWLGRFCIVGQDKKIIVQHFF
jgi:hypothetical protein